MKGKMRFILLFVLVTLLAFPSAGAADARELAQQARKKLDEGDGLARADKLAEASASYLRAAELYELALQQEPDDRASRQNLLYSLGQRGMIHIRKGQKAIKDKNFEGAAGLYAAAMAAYDLALQKQPQEKNFQVNRTYCRNQWGLAQFQVKLASRGTAHPFQLTGLNGSAVELAKHKGKVVVLEFVAGWCPSCRESMPKLVELRRRFQGKPVQVLVLALDRVEGWKKSGSEEKSQALSRETGLTFAWADEATYYQYGSFNSIPTLILIDKSGRIAAQAAAEEREPDKLAKLITQLL